MTSDVIVAILALIGTGIGSLAGILAANKLTNYRIAELEKKVDRHNTVMERVALLETDSKTQWKRFDELHEEVENIKRFVYGGNGK